MKQKYVFSNCVKAIAIIIIMMQHSLQLNQNFAFADFANKYYLHFWMYQMVSLLIVITGFHYTASIEKLESADVWYRKDIFKAKFLRLMIPYTVMYVVWAVYALLTNRVVFDIQLLFWFLSGGVGPGGYYTCVMVQILIIFPVIYYGIKKYPFWGTCFILLINILFEYMVYQGVFRDSFYRLCSIRLLAGVVLGILIYRYKEQLKNSYIPHLLFSAGALFLAWWVFGGYKLQMMKTTWAVSSYVSVPYAAGLVALMICAEESTKVITNKFVKKIYKVIELIGKASYHIFLTQQLYFSVNYAWRKLYRVRYVTIMDIVLCTVVGCLFYVVHAKATQRIKIKKG